jgi:ParB-like chromosome segregation protein Spo0J
VPAITNRQQLPDEAKMVVDLCERLGFMRWEYDPHRPRPKDPASQRVQVREVAHYAPPAQVTQYVHAYKNNEPLPPIVLSRDGYLIDGNTRVYAAEKLSFPTMKAIVLGHDYEGADEGLRVRMKLLGAAFNVRNGKGIDREELRKAVLAVAQDKSWDANRIAYLLNCTPKLAEGFINEDKARKRAEAANLSPNGSLKPTHLRQLGAAHLNERPWKALFTLAQDTGMSSDELARIIKEVKEKQDDEAALEVIERQREQRWDQIEEYRAKGKAHPPYAAQSRQHYGFYLKFKGTEARLVDRGDVRPGEYLAQTEEVIGILQEVAAQQRRFDERWKEQRRGESPRA